MKKSALVLIPLALADALLAPLSACAATFGPYTYTIADGKATITDFDRAFSGALAITNKLGGHPVTSIGDSAFLPDQRLLRRPSPDTRIGPVLCHPHFLWLVGETAHRASEWA